MFMLRTILEDGRKLLYDYDLEYGYVHEKDQEETSS
jgi:hypothetical protein